MEQPVARAAENAEFTLAIDPGQRNMAMWLGHIDPLTQEPITEALEKCDLLNGLSKKNAPPLYCAAIDALRSKPWFPQRVARVVVETQAPRNIPARIIATALYAYARGRGIASVEFSGAKLKDGAMKAVAARRKLQLRPHPTKEEMPDAAKRRRSMHAVNKANATMLAAELLKDTPWADALQEACDPRKKTKKGDDMADALLLGIGACLQTSKKE
jgi:hypothetical protein